jgi:hypothetical protein
MTNLSALEKRVRELEVMLLTMSVSKDCRCRFGQVTKYHTAADLEHIMSVSCPVHEFRDLGELLWVPPGMPLRPEDSHLCSCPPCPTRDLLEGKRGPLTQEEQEDECCTWELTADTAEDFSIERARLKALLHKYARKCGREP